MLIKQKNPSLPRNLTLRTFGELPIVFLTKVNRIYLLYSTVQRCCLLHLIKQNCLMKTFLRTLILMTQVYLYLFSASRTNQKLHNISVTPKMVKKFIKNLDLSKASGPDCIPVVVPKNCEPELFYILAELFNKDLKESCFPDCWKVSLVAPIFKNVGERSTAKNYRPVSLLSVVNKVFEKLVNNRIVDHQENCSLFSDFLYGFGSSRSTAHLLTVVFDRIARAFKRSGATPGVALDVSKALDKAFHKLTSYGVSGQIFGLISYFLSNRWLRVVLDGKSSQNSQLILEFHKPPFLVLHFSHYTLLTFVMMSFVILLSMLMILLSILSVIRHLICDNNLNWLLSLNLIYETLWTGAGSG